MVVEITASVFRDRLKVIVGFLMVAVAFYEGSLTFFLVIVTVAVS